MPSPVLEHVLGIDLPYVIEDFVHAILHFSLLFESVQYVSSGAIFELHDPPVGRSLV